MRVISPFFISELKRWASSGKVFGASFPMF